MALRRAAWVLLMVLHVVPTFLAQQTECTSATASLPVSGAAGDQSMFSESVLERHCSQRRLLAPPWSRGTPRHLVRTFAGMTRHAVKRAPNLLICKPTFRPYSSTIYDDAVLRCGSGYCWRMPYKRSWDLLERWQQWVSLLLRRRFVRLAGELPSRQPWRGPV